MFWLSVVCGFLLAPAEESLQPQSKMVFKGNVAEVTRSGRLRTPGKEFTLTIWLEDTEPAAKLFWFVEEKGSGAWHWPERFGQTKLNTLWQADSGAVPSLLYDYGADTSIVTIPLPFLQTSEKLKQDHTWKQGTESLEVVAESKIQDRNTWVVEIKNPFGFQRRLWVAQESELVPRLERRVFMNMGTEYRLTMQLESLAVLDSETWLPTATTLRKLVELRQQLQRPQQTKEPDLSAAQLDVLKEQWPKLQKELAGDLFGPLAKAIESDLQSQTTRQNSLATMIQQAEGRAIPEFELEKLGGGTMKSKEMRKQVTILHFWDYSDEKLEQPYGQVGYLDFLHGKREKSGIKVYGVAVNAGFNDAAQKPAAERTVKRLQRFMRLGYPILFDDGKVLKAFGDPRTAGGSLPVFVVVDGNGKIIHYHVGEYELNRDRGLTELDNIAMEALREATGSKD